MNGKRLYLGDYLSEINKRSPLPDVVTVVEHIGTLGECRAKVFPARAFEGIEWKGFTLRGYGKCAELPRMTAVDMTDAVTAWNFRIVENGQMVLYATRAERDEQLSDEGRELLAKAERALTQSSEPKLYRVTYKSGDHLDVSTDQFNKRGEAGWRLDQHAEDYGSVVSIDLIAESATDEPKAQATS